MAEKNQNNSSSSRYLMSDKEEARKVFDRFDKNGDGKISADELAGVIEALGSKTSPEEISRMMDEMDSDKDGFVSLDEFAEFCKIGVSEDESGFVELRDAFDMYDEDKNGLISASELHHVLIRLGERCSVQDCSRMIQSVDGDGDGNVDFEEFRKMMAKSASSAS